MRTEDCIILALDGMSNYDATLLLSKIGHRIYAAKIHDMWDRSHYDAIFACRSCCERVWIDAKLHDIPTTAENRAKILAAAGADIITVHASGGQEMIASAVKSLARIYAVTALTSMSDESVRLIYGGSRPQIVQVLAREAIYGDAHGIVCSAVDIGSIAELVRTSGKKMEFVVPGTRSIGVGHNDQKNVVTPADAIRLGATKLVIGREITAAIDPVAALDRIAEDIGEL